MGWLWSSPGADKDAFASLDPKLRDYLDKETAQQQQHQRQQSYPPSTLSTDTPQPSSSDAATEQSFSEKIGLGNPFASGRPANSASSLAVAATTDQPSSPSIPPQSLYQDGRYAHLWKTYRSTPAVTEAQTSQEQLQSVLSAYQSRRGEVSRAALENCVEEHLAENACFASGTLRQKLGGCRTESRRFARCFELQTRLLRALGYMDVDLETAADATDRRERMRMRADEIWIEVCRREDLRADCEKKGLPCPAFEPLAELRNAKWAKLTPTTAGGESQLDLHAPGADADADAAREAALLKFFTPEKRTEMQSRLARIPSPTERELEIKLELAEAEVHRGYGARVGQYLEMEQKERRERREKGTSTVGDWMKWLGGWKD